MTIRTSEEHSHNTVRADISINKRLNQTPNIEFFHVKEIESQAIFISQFLEQDGEFPFPLPPYLITILDFNRSILDEYIKNRLNGKFNKMNWLQEEIIGSEITDQISEQIVFYLLLIGLGEIKESDSEEKEELSKAIESITAIPDKTWSKRFSTFKRKLDLILSSSEKNSDTKYIQNYFNGIEELIHLEVLNSYDYTIGNRSKQESYKLHDKTDLSRMRKFINCYEKISFTRIYKFGFSFEEDFVYNTLSSGEKTLLKFGSNLWQLNTKIKDNYSDKLSVELKTPDLKVPDNLLLMLDEAELTLHPEWQKTFLDWSLKIIKIVCSSFNSVQVLYSSHSPFFLSDLPKGNVIFLKSKEGKDNSGNNINLCHVCAKEEKPEQTFGANIHSLYRNSFFLEDGLMGEFAKGKIDRVIRNLSNETLHEEDKMNPRDIQFVIQQIGEPLIKNKLQEMYDQHFHFNLEDRIVKLEKELQELKARES